MIITASKAWNQAHHGKKIPKNWEKYPMRELRRIENKINRLSKKGKTSMDYFHSMTCMVEEVLEKNGYEVRIRSDYDYEWYVISWEKKKTTT